MTTKPVYHYKAHIVRIIDGDTVVVHIDLGFGVWLHQQHVRLAGIDTPEIRTRDLKEKARGVAAKQFLMSLLPVEMPVILESKEFKDSRGKYGRILGDIITDRGSVVQLLKENGHEKNKDT